MHRRLSERFRNTEQMKAGVKLENGGQLHVCINPAIQFDSKGHVQLLSESPRCRTRAHASSPTSTLTDNRILASAAYLADTHRRTTILVTKDLNMQLKARTLGIEAQDYRTDRSRTATSAARSAAAGRRNTTPSIFPATPSRPLRARSASF